MANAETGRAWCRPEQSLLRASLPPRCEARRCDPLPAFGENVSVLLGVCLGWIAGPRVTSCYSEVLSSCFLKRLHHFAFRLVISEALSPQPCWRVSLPLDHSGSHLGRDLTWLC